jgi:hypothetical protein
MDEDMIDKLFFNPDDFYPGSKRKRRTALPVPEKAESENDVKFVTKTLPNGNIIDLVSAGALATALGRPLVTLRLWERKGYIPRAPYRLRSILVDGVKKPGWRMYSRAMVDSIVSSFRSRGLLEAPRIDWNNHRDLSVEVLESWTRIHNEETKIG